MVYFNINETDSHKIIREWLALYVYAGLPVAESTIDGLTSNLIEALKRGLAVSKDTTKISTDGTTL
jgi:hypothetical protein